MRVKLLCNRSVVAAGIAAALMLTVLLRQMKLAEQEALRRLEILLIGQLGPTDQLVWKLRDFRLTEINCLNLISGDPDQLTKGLAAAPIASVTDYQHSRAACDDIRSQLVTATLSEEERRFPIAFSIMVYKDFDQVMRLLKAIYRPEHCYCLHVDSKSSLWFRAAARTFAKCLDNVIFAEPSIDVQWGRYSVLEAELLCWRLLLDKCHNSWLYLLNLTGQEYPLRTMKELVGILRALNGANNIENAGPVASYEPPFAASLLPDGANRSIAWHKGSVHVAVCRGFAEFVFSPVGAALQAELRTQDSQRRREPPTDELLFATINYNSGALRVPGAPSARPSQATDNVNLPFFPRYKNWIAGVFGYPCLSGKIVRGICIWGLTDLPAMNKRPELFANKFLAEFQPLAQRCLEERFWHNSLADYGLMGLNKTWTVDAANYSNYSFVQHHT